MADLSLTAFIPCASAQTKSVFDGEMPRVGIAGGRGHE